MEGGRNVHKLNGLFGEEEEEEEEEKKKIRTKRMTFSQKCEKAKN